MGHKNEAICLCLRNEQTVKSWDRHTQDAGRKALAPPARLRYNARVSARCAQSARNGRKTSPIPLHSAKSSLPENLRNFLIERHKSGARTLVRTPRVFDHGLLRAFRKNTESECAFSCPRRAGTDEGEQQGRTPAKKRNLSSELLFAWQSNRSIRISDT